MLIQNLKPIKDKLDVIDDKLNQILTGGENGLNFTPLTLTPTYQPFASFGWETSPTDLAAITDGDSNTSTNLFWIGGQSWATGGITIIPSIAIPPYTRINMKVGLRNSHGLRSGFSLSFFNISAGSYTPFWGVIDIFPNNVDIVANIDRIIPFAWDKAQFTLHDLTQYNPQARIYDLRVWSVN